jgi:hypothetical protein
MSTGNVVRSNTDRYTGHRLYEKGPESDYAISKSIFGVGLLGHWAGALPL